MRISTRGRYALRIMVDLARHQGDGYPALNEVARSLPGAGKRGCPRKDECAPLPLWQGLEKVIGAYPDGITPERLVNQNSEE